MANIKVDVKCAITNGSEVSFTAPCDCTAVTGLKVNYPGGSKVFTFKDVHGYDLTGVGNLFRRGAVVKAILDVSNGHAYLQNAGTNRYLENLIHNTSSPWNVLDNADFNQIVDQRGDGTYTGKGYGFDRWLSFSDALTASAIPFTDSTSTESIGVLHLENNNPDGLAVFCQRIEPKKSGYMAGKVFTFAVCRANGWIDVCSGVCGSEIVTGTSNVRQFQTLCSDGIHSIEVFKNSGTQNFEVRINVEKGGAVDLAWVALYEGGYFPYTLPKYRPKGYAAELLECRRYYYVLSNSVKTGFISQDSEGTLLRLGIPLPVTMRATPTMSILSASGLRMVVGCNETPEILSSSVHLYDDCSIRIDLRITPYLNTVYDTPIAMYFSAILDANL